MTTLAGIRMATRLVADRTIVLVAGLAMGAAIALAFVQVPPGLPSAPAPREPAPPPPAVARAQVVPPRLAAALAQGRPIQVGVFGDSYGDGIWAGLLRLLPEKQGFALHKFSKQSTGFTRYRSLNLEDATAHDLKDTPIDIAVVSFGANDTNAIYENKRLSAYMSPEWKAIVSSRVERLVGLLRKQGAVVYWVGLPRMRKPAFDTDIRAMNDFYAELMGRLQVPFAPTDALSVDAAGRYADYLPDAASDAPRLMRAGDGVHMSMLGYTHITRPLARQITAFVDAARPAPPSRT